MHVTGSVATYSCETFKLVAYSCVASLHNDVLNKIVSPWNRQRTAKANWFFFLLLISHQFCGAVIVNIVKCETFLSPSNAPWITLTRTNTNRHKYVNDEQKCYDPPVGHLPRNELMPSAVCGNSVFQIFRAIDIRTFFWSVGPYWIARNTLCKRSADDLVYFVSSSKWTATAAQ